MASPSRSAASIFGRAAEDEGGLGLPFPRMWPDLTLLSIIRYSVAEQGGKPVPLEREKKALLWRLPSQVTSNYEYANDRLLASQVHN